VSERSCVGCRETAAREELLRFVLRDGQVSFDASKKSPGRGVWTHSSTQCFEKAVKTGALARGLRAPKSAQDEDVVNRLRADVALFLEKN